MEEGKITFFGAVDRKGKREDGMIGSSYPAWFDQRKIEDLENSIQFQEGMLERGQVQPEGVMRAKMDLAREKKILADIKSSKPKLRDKDHDAVAKGRDALEEKIGESMFTKKAMMEGLADAHEEAKRMSEPCIPVDPVLAEACGLKDKMNKKGMIPRNHAVKIWQICQSYLGDDRGTNVEILRRG